MSKYFLEDTQMADKHVKTPSKLLTIRKSQI